MDGWMDWSIHSLRSRFMQYSHKDRRQVLHRRGPALSRLKAASPGTAPFHLASPALRLQNSVSSIVWA
jgi:hypothetical protein